MAHYQVVLPLHTSYELRSGKYKIYIYIQGQFLTGFPGYAIYL